MENRCEFWLPRKSRFCSNARFNDSLYCGNHNQRTDAKWIPCPIDPSHCVLKENLEGHKKRCPLFKQAQSLSAQPYYSKGINACDVEERNEEDKDQARRPTSEMKRNAVYGMSSFDFCSLIRKIVAVHASVCGEIRDSYKVPEACDVWTKREIDRKLPFQEKHVVQQASILGNLEEFGVLKSCVGNVTGKQCDGKDINVRAVVEFGAGRGYLTQMLADCYGINRVFLVERKSYKLKADRSLRQKDNLMLERLRIDIEDLNLNGVDSLRGIPYLAVGKHLCGPATDLTLRCCLRKQHTEHNTANLSGGCRLRSLAIATCCHHLCQWMHYINKQYFKNLGISEEEFNAITWFTSWAVDADHSSDLTDGKDGQLDLTFMEKEPYGANASGVEVVRNMKAVDRAVLGFMCKEIVDIGRLMWMKGHGMVSQLVKYVPPKISPENHLLIAGDRDRSMTERFKI